MSASADPRVPAVAWRDLLPLSRADVLRELTLSLLVRRLDRAASELAALKVF